MKAPEPRSVSVQGETFLVRPVTVALAAEMAAAEGDSSAVYAAGRKIVERCCRLSDGSPVPFDELTLPAFDALVGAAFAPPAASGPDPTKAPPGSSGSGAWG